MGRPPCLSPPPARRPEGDTFFRKTGRIPVLWLWNRSSEAKGDGCDVRGGRYLRSWRVSRGNALVDRRLGDGRVLEAATGTAGPSWGGWYRSAKYVGSSQRRMTASTQGATSSRVGRYQLTDVSRSERGWTIPESPSVSGRPPRSDDGDAVEHRLDGDERLILAMARASRAEDLRDLVPHRIGIFSLEHGTTAHAVRRLDLEGLAELIRRDQRPAVALVTGLAAAIPPGRRSWRASLDVHVQRNRSRRLRRVGGVLVKPRLQVGDPFLQGGDDHQNRRLSFRRDGVPDRFRDRRVRAPPPDSASLLQKNSGP